MTEKFDILFDTAFLHSFFESGQLTAFDVQVDSKTQHLLRDLHLLFKKTNNGFVVLYNAGRYQSALPESLVKNKKITVEMYVPDNRFLNYTGLDGYSANKVLYFSNARTHNTVAGDNGTVSLAENEKAGANDWYEWCTDTVQLSCAQNQENKCSIIDVFGNEFAPGMIYPGSAVFKNLSGAYTLVNEKQEKRKIYAASKTNRTKPFAIIDIYLYAPQISPAFVLFDEGKVSSKHFSISFDSRSTTWRYYIVNRNLESIDNVLVKSNNGVNFVDAGQQKVAGGDAKVFLTDKPLLLKQKPKQKFYLSYDHGAGAGEVNILENLPLPSADYVFIDGTSVYSDVYIYV